MTDNEMKLAQVLRETFNMLIEVIPINYKGDPKLLDLFGRVERTIKPYMPAILAAEKNDSVKPQK